MQAFHGFFAGQAVHILAKATEAVARFMHITEAIESFDENLQIASLSPGWFLLQAESNSDDGTNGSD